MSVVLPTAWGAAGELGSLGTFAPEGATAVVEVVELSVATGVACGSAARAAVAALKSVPHTSCQPTIPFERFEGYICPWGHRQKHSETGGCPANTAARVVPT